LSIIVNGVQVDRVFSNGVEMNEVWENGVKVFEKGPTETTLLSGSYTIYAGTSYLGISLNPRSSTRGRLTNGRSKQVRVYIDHFWENATFTKQYVRKWFTINPGQTVEFTTFVYVDRVIVTSIIEVG